MSTQIIGHAWALDVLRRHLKSGATRHAYLVTGPKGVGRSTLVGWFAQALLCRPQEGLESPCGKCDGCQLVAKHAHPDLHWLKAEGGLKVDDIRSLHHDLSLSPYQADRRVAVLPDFEAATTGAANALLKTLEEPPPHVVLVLTAVSEESLLPTIVSRCEILSLRPSGIWELAEALKARGESDQAALGIATQAMGRPGLALKWLEDPEALRERSMFIEDGLRLLGMSRADRFGYAADVNHHKTPAENREAATTVLEAWLGLWRDVLHEAHGMDGQASYSEVKLEIQKVAARVEPGEIEGLVRDIETALRRIAANANPLLAMEVVMLSLPKVNLG